MTEGRESMHCTGGTPLQDKQVATAWFNQVQLLLPRLGASAGRASGCGVSRPGTSVAQRTGRVSARFAPAAGVPAAKAVQHCDSSGEGLESLTLSSAGSTQWKAAPDAVSLNGRLGPCMQYSGPLPHQPHWLQGRAAASQGGWQGLKPASELPWAAYTLPRRNQVLLQSAAAQAGGPPAAVVHAEGVAASNHASRGLPARAASAVAPPIWGKGPVAWDPSPFWHRVVVSTRRQLPRSTVSCKLDYQP